MPLSRLAITVLFTVIANEEKQSRDTCTSTTIPHCCNKVLMTVGSPCAPGPGKHT
jgi:hypothetical protein